MVCGFRIKIDPGRPESIAHKHAMCHDVTTTQNQADKLCNGELCRGHECVGKILPYSTATNAQPEQQILTRSNYDCCPQILIKNKINNLLQMLYSSR